jgi:hypothetical protein
MAEVQPKKAKFEDSYDLFEVRIYEDELRLQLSRQPSLPCSDLRC